VFRHGRNAPGTRTKRIPAVFNARTRGRWHAPLLQRSGAVRGVQAKTQAAGQRASDSWSDVQDSWNAHLAKARKDVDQRKAEFNASDAEDRADWAEGDADLAIDYAYSAIEEAEYAVLDAILARREADEAAVAAHR
jgi:hypothetical protein